MKLIGSRSALESTPTFWPRARSMQRSSAQRSAITRSLGYQRGLANRIGLDGQPVEPIDPEHAAAARELLEKRAKKLAARRKNSQSGPLGQSDPSGQCSQSDRRSQSDPSAPKSARLSLADLRSAAALRRKAVA